MFRIGIGYDVHRLIEGRPLIIGGVKIPHDKGLLGHSDADVLLHAICDAILGAASLGDIGKLFPDSDDTYKGISSLILLQEVVKELFSKGYRVVNIDSVVIAQKPKLASYINEMREKIASAVEIPVEYVSVKATTTERLGFEGKEEGIAAQAVVLIEGGED
ncbi:2-C-methyl-D-erythritol 2,4-cyclodiphosphate synthase [Desulfurobacterium indicum]|uniref:2-C-methyl-D-erythritol 2,4-cyclodiphosphate synthase n=1 Tax=Desulfurobacterium indicum TaxID=1914305 RepID=A0A1R1MN19_9BACT|nr:2-C-methyl-D-erythritol 2,4-cyclodiphosphate synthase [Desulfurobacterium indicum]OMH41153.1 2-C-methyl-D-erythritol 2,4-cyclodiphosphate synthase [Desulfurobacterium indicum]